MHRSLHPVLLMLSTVSALFAISAPAAAPARAGEEAADPRAFQHYHTSGSGGAFHALPRGCESEAVSDIRYSHGLQFSAYVKLLDGRELGISGVDVRARCTHLSEEIRGRTGGEGRLFYGGFGCFPYPSGRGAEAPTCEIELSYRGKRLMISREKLRNRHVLEVHVMGCPNYWGMREE